MQIVWDEPKRRLNLAKHGHDFADLTGAFFLGAMVAPARDGRYMAIGPLKADLVSVVFSLLGREGISVISLRAASRSERRQYDARTRIPDR